MYIAPKSIASPLHVTIIARVPVASIAPASLQVTVVPALSITSIVPDMVAAGDIQTVTVSGTGFFDNSAISITSSVDGQQPVITNEKILSSTTMTFSIASQSGESGTVDISVTNPSPGGLPIASSSLPLFVSPLPEQGTAGLPVFNVSSFSASGSAQSYTCSGAKGSTVLICDQPTLDFSVGQGIRIVGGGGPEANPPIATQPVITRITTRGTNETGTHSYCYVVYVVDALGGVSSPSPESCIDNEPSLSFDATYNQLGGTYYQPIAAFLWYVSEDNGPYRLFSVDQGMDGGQHIDSRGGWLTRYSPGASGPSKNEDLFTVVEQVSGNQVILRVPLASSVESVTVDHDDTRAVQRAINAAVSAGGGIIKLGNGTFNLRRPAYSYYPRNIPNNPFPTFTTDYSLKPATDGYTSLYIPNGSTGNIYLDGNGVSTTINTQPDFGGRAELLAIGNFTRPAYAPLTSIRIEDVEKGSKAITLVNTNDINSLHPGDDIWLYSGSFSPSATSAPCVDSDNTAGGQCHFSELNTIRAIDGDNIELAYPASKRYYDDGKNSFGLVKMPVTPHNVGVENVEVNSYNTIIGVGMVYGLLVDNVHVNGFPLEGAFMGGWKRDVLIENSSWGVGEGNKTAAAVEEFDQCTNVAFINNMIVGYSAPGSEAFAEEARVYLTEGTSETVFEGNTFSHVSLGFQDTTDDVIKGNTFDDATIAVGDNYNPSGHEFMRGYPQDQSIVSFDSQVSAAIEDNMFTIDSGFTPPWVISLGNFASGLIDGNEIAYSANGSAIIMSDGGDIRGNIINVSSPDRDAVGIAAVPDEGPNAQAGGFLIENNSVSGQIVQSAVDIISTQFDDTSPVCIRRNSIDIQHGNAVSIASSATNISCSDNP